MTHQIKTIDHGFVNIVSRKSEMYYLRCIDLIQCSDGTYYEIWIHPNGYKGAILVED